MIALIDSGVANISSVIYALERLDCQVQLTRDKAEIKSASHVILPGVGHASAAMAALEKYDLVETIKSLTQPVMGICVGMQLLFARSEEGHCQTLGIIPHTVSRLQADDLPIPHMGWNQLEFTQPHPLLDGITSGAYVYFVHSYAAPVGQETLASCHYGQPFTAIVQKDNFYGCQFHVERSGQVGHQILKHFIKLS